MLSPQIIYKQVNNITSELIEISLCEDQNFPNMIINNNITEIGITKKNEFDSSKILKNIPYHELYDYLYASKMYNIKMIDQALISLNYRFKNDCLIGHRLSFFPAPDLLLFQNDPEVFMNDIMYSEVIDKRVVSVPIRFDFDNRTEVFSPINHPISHLTLGQYKNCRIPVSQALTPYEFIRFIVQNFYNTSFEFYCKNISKPVEFFQKSILEEENKVMNINTPNY